MMTDKILTIKEVASKGGKTTKKKYGSEHFANIARKGHKTTQARYGKDFYSRIGSLPKKKTKDTMDEQKNSNE